MTDFGLDDDIIREDIRIKTLRWHGLLSKNAGNRAGKPILGDIIVQTKGGLGSDSGVNPLNPVSKDTNRNT